MALIAVLMALSLPMLSVANAEARSVVCRQNLADMGSAITGYIHDNDQLPSLSELPPHYEGMSLPELVSPRLHTPDVVFCPSDETDRSQVLGTSYRWVAAYNALQLNNLDRAVDMPVLLDRDTFHQGVELPVNELVLRRNERGSYNFAVIGITEQEREATDKAIDEQDDKTNNSDRGNKFGHDKHKSRTHAHGESKLLRNDKNFGRWKD